MRLQSNVVSRSHSHGEQQDAPIDADIQIDGILAVRSHTHQHGRQRLGEHQSSSGAEPESNKPSVMS